MKNKKVVYTIIGIIALVLVALAITYAYWQITKTQEGVNEITTACLDITLVDAEAGNTGVSLLEQYPISDTEGAELTPYKFTVTNNCDTEVDYQIALESTGDSTTSISQGAIKVMLDDATSLLSSNETLTPTASGAYASHKLGMGSLAATGESGASVTHELRLWIDESAPVSENNKSYTGKISVTIGQGIENVVSLKNTLLAAYGGESAITSISYEKEDTITSTGSLYLSDATTEYYFGTAYTVEEGRYSLSGTIVKSSLTDCRNETNACGKYTIRNSSSETETSSYIYEITDFQTTGNYASGNVREFVNDFYFAPTANESGMYKMADDYGDSYYYRGDIINNYVKFGLYSEDTEISYYTEADSWTPITKTIAAGTPMYWRIVRINGDGTIRLIYAGTEFTEDGKSTDDHIYYGLYNNDYSHKMHVGYMYGTEDDPYGDNDSTTLTDSAVKAAVDDWYESTLKTNYEDYIADSIFCNDREEYETYEDGSVNFAADNRIRKDLPVLTCTNKRDRFTVDDTTLGNGRLSNPVGLITADELLMAGPTSKAFYNNTNTAAVYNRYWTMSPSYYSPTAGLEGTGIAYIYSLLGESVGHDVGDEYAYYYGASPVINLKADVEFTYNNEDTAGTFADPYVVTTN